MENEFLQKVNLDLLKSELKMDVDAIAGLLGVNAQTVYKWKREKSKGGCRPTYDSIITLLNNGASLQSIFGITNYKDPGKTGGKVTVDADFIAGVREALKDLASH